MLFGQRALGTLPDDLHKGSPVDVASSPSPLDVEKADHVERRDQSKELAHDEPVRLG